MWWCEKQTQKTCSEERREGMGRGKTDETIDKEEKQEQKELLNWLKWKK
jgi:hypothetical protein